MCTCLEFTITFTSILFTTETWAIANNSFHLCLFLISADGLRAQIKRLSAKQSAHNLNIVRPFFGSWSLNCLQNAREPAANWIAYLKISTGLYAVTAARYFFICEYTAFVLWFFEQEAEIEREKMAAQKLSVLLQRHFSASRFGIWLNDPAVVGGKTGCSVSIVSFNDIWDK